VRDLRATTGVVRAWYGDHGWGVLDSPDTPGGCWAHMSCVLVEGDRSLEVGQEVVFVPEAADQDGYAFLAVEVWPADREPVRVPASSYDAHDAFRSTLTIVWDDEPPSSGPVRR